MSALGIIDRVSNRASDLFRVALIETFENTHLPEMYEVLGKKEFLKLLDIFESSTCFKCPNCKAGMKFPTMQHLNDVLQDVAVYCRISGTPKGSKARVIRDLADEFGTTPGKIRTSFYRMERRAQKYEVSLTT